MARSRPFAYLLAALCAIGSIGAASAATLDFERFGIGEYPSLTTGGLVFAPTARDRLGVVPAGNGKAISPRWGDTMTVTPGGDDTFSLRSLAYAGYWANVSKRVEITGERLDGTRLRSAFDYAPGTWKRHALNWDQLVRVEFATTDGRVMLDDFDVELTPRLTPQVITFETLAPGTFSAIQIGGFDFVPQAQPIVDVYDDGTTRSLSHKWGDRLHMARADGRSFSLSGLGYRGRWSNGRGRLEVQGLRTDGTRLTRTLGYDGMAWRTASLDWTGLASVQFFTPDGRVMLDDIDISHAPTVTPPVLPPVLPPAPSPGCVPTTREARMLGLVNEARATSRQCGSTRYAATTPLAWNCKLRQAATRHSQDMASNNFFSHTGSDGSTLRERVTDTAYPWRAIAENIAAGYRSEEAVVSGWLSSPGHCANIMRPEYADMGSSVVETTQARYPNYWTQVFGTPR